jgi:quercetin dioxygenase-like cupin family protein
VTIRLVIAVVGLSCTASVTEATGPKPSAEARLLPTDIEALATISAGAGRSGANGIRTSVLAGNPAAAGPYTIALRVPAHTRIAAHSHRDARSATVVSGTWWFGYGPKVNVARLRPLPPGSFYTEPADVPHFARTGTRPVVVYITGVGPTDTRYVDIDHGPGS